MSFAYESSKDTHCNENDSSALTLFLLYWWCWSLLGTIVSLQFIAISFTVSVITSNHVVPVHADTLKVMIAHSISLWVFQASYVPWSCSPNSILSSPQTKLNPCLLKGVPTVWQQATCIKCTTSCDHTYCSDSYSNADKSST